MTLTFDPVGHVYQLDGKTLPHVTGILASEGLIDSSWFTEYGRDRGRLVHRVIQLYDDGELEEATVDPILQPYLQAWQRFKAESGFIVDASEVAMASDIYQVAGMVDKIGRFNERRAIVDIKSGAIQPWMGLQLALYQILLGDPTTIRCAVKLSDDGKYRFHRFTDRQDRQVALAVVAVHQWKIKNGGKRNDAGNP